MKNHLFTARHKRAWLYVKTGDYLEHQNEISQRIAEFTRDFQRNYNLIKEVVDRSLWRKVREGRMETVYDRKPKREYSPRNDYDRQGGSRQTDRERSYEGRSRYSEDRDERRYSG